MSDTKIENKLEGGDANAIIEFAKRRCEPRLSSIEFMLDDETDNIPIFIGHDSAGNAYLKSVKPFADEWRTHPERRKGTLTLSTIESFVAAVNRDSGESSVIFADNGPSPKLVAVLDFHAAGIEGTPSFCENRIVYPFPLSDEWIAWTAKNGPAKAMGQAAFAEFIEDRFFDVAEPGNAGATTAAWAEKMALKLAGPAELMRVSRGLSLRVEETISNVVKLESGETSLVFSTEHKTAGGEQMRVPAAFHIRVPILQGGADYSIPVRLRYRASGGKVSWFYEMHRPELFLRDAVNDAITLVRQPEEATDASSVGCGLPVLMGTPPA